MAQEPCRLIQSAKRNGSAQRDVFLPGSAVRKRSSSASSTMQQSHPQSWVRGAVVTDEKSRKMVEASTAARSERVRCQLRKQTPTVSSSSSRMENASSPLMPNQRHAA